MDILELIKNMDSETLKKSIAQAKEFLSTQEGAEKARQLASGNFNSADLPEDFKKAAEALKNDKSAQKILEGYLNKNG